VPAARQPLHDSWPCRDVELQAHFEPLALICQAVGKLQRGISRGNVKRDNQPLPGEVKRGIGLRRILQLQLLSKLGSGHAEA